MTQPAPESTLKGHISVSQLQAFLTEAMRRLGLPGDDAATVGKLMAEAEAQGSDGHGAIRLLPYAKRIHAGGVNARPVISIAQERAATALLDGDNGMGHLVMQKAAKMAVEKARKCGVGWVGSFNSNHAGPASLYARMPLADDMIGMYFAVGNANHLPPWGGLEMLLSTNPIAVAVPARLEPPVVLDMATTVAAYGKVKARAQRGEMMPPGWMIDRLGQPLLDPKKAADGFLLPIGDYKGYGLALIVGLLAGTLNGAAMGKDVIDFNADASTPTNTGQAVLAIDIAAFGDVDAFKSRVDELARTFRESERMPGVDRIWLPGEQSFQKRTASARDGMLLPETLLSQLRSFALENGLDPLVPA